MYTGGAILLSAGLAFFVWSFKNGNTAAALLAGVFGGAMVGVGAFLLTLALMCENVNAAPDVPARLAEVGNANLMPDRSGLPVAAPILSHPICQTGFTIAQRYDERNAAGAITKSVWVRKCTKGKIIYGGKV